MPSNVASTTPATTPALRSTPFVRDWLRLGCTTSIAAIAAKTGGGPSGISRSETTHARIVARAVLTIWSKGSRLAARTAPVSAMGPT